MCLLDPRLCGTAATVSTFLQYKMSAISPLHSHAVKVTTLRLYTVSCLRFLDWLSVQVLSLQSVADLDDALSLYTSVTYDDNPRRGERQKCINAMAGLEFFIPSLQQKLRSTRLAVRGWDRLVPSKPPLPLPESVMRALCGLFVSQNDLFLEFTLHLAFDGYLRAMELLGLTVGHVFLPDDPRFPQYDASSFAGGCMIPVAKTGNNQFVRFPTGVFSMLSITGQGRER